MDKKEKFNKNKYDNEYKKNNYKRIFVDIKKNEAEVFQHKLNLLGITRSQFLKEVISNFISDVKISYDSEELIEELKKDMIEFGDIEMYAFIDYISNQEIITNYDFIETEAPLTEEEIASCDRIIKLPASEILKRLKKQNEIC